MKEIISKYLKDHGFGEFNPKAVLFDMDGVLYNSMPNPVSYTHLTLPTIA